MGSFGYSVVYPENPKAQADRLQSCKSSNRILYLCKFFLDRFGVDIWNAFDTDTIKFLARLTKRAKRAAILRVTRQRQLVVDAVFDSA